MTAGKMIEIISKTEEEYYDTLWKCIKRLGTDAEATKQQREKWIAIYDLCKKLDIPT